MSPQKRVSPFPIHLSVRIGMALIKAAPASQWNESGAQRSPGCPSARGLVANTRQIQRADEVIEQFPVTREQIDGLKAFVARSLETVPA